MMRMIAVVSALVCTQIALLGSPVLAQSPFSPAYSVNSSFITTYDISQRIALLRALGANGNLEALALDQLTDDVLKKQAARELGIALEPGAMARGLDDFAARRNLTGAELAGQLRGAGIAQQTLDDFFASGLLWRSVVQGRFQARATPSEADLEAVLQISAAAQQQSVLVSELALPFAELGEEEARKLAARLSRQLDGRGDFSAAVRQYSRAASAQNNGSLGWMPASQLPPGLAGLVLSLMPGEVTAPIEVSAGVILLKLNGIRNDASARPTTMSVTYGRLSVPLAKSASSVEERAARERLQGISGRLRNCRDAVRLAAEFGPDSGQFGPVSTAEIPNRLALQLSRLDTGETAIIREAANLSLIVLCVRQADVDADQREAIRDSLFNQRMNSFGQGYLQELRRDAVIIAR